MTNQSQNFVNALSIYTKKSVNELTDIMGTLSQLSGDKTLNALNDRAKKDYQDGKTYKDDLDIELSLDEVLEANTSRYGRYMKWGFENIKTFDNELLNDIANGLELKLYTDNINKIKNGVVIYQEGSTYNFMNIVDGKVDRPKDLFSKPKCMANGVYHRFQKPIIGIIA